jgi:hypothetical protein
MAVTIIVALGLMTFFRHLLKLRETQAPEVVHANKSPETVEPPETTAVRHDLAA